MVATKELLDKIIQEEQDLVLEHFDEQDAWHLGIILKREAEDKKYPVAIDIRRHNQILFHVALPGATADNEEWIRRKANVVFRFHRPSLAIGVELVLAGVTLEQKYFVSPLEYSAHGGSFPIRVEGVGLVACVTVSGLPQEEDHRLVVEGLRRFKGRGL
ncbi:MAG: heme-degrading domain-containing protein [Breznakiellaceae bacterium]|mgnify:CR=1 FL=1